LILENTFYFFCDNSFYSQGKYFKT